MLKGNFKQLFRCDFILYSRRNLSILHYMYSVDCHI
jgi:hypothetical protein